jgi:hypothetical protein
LRPIGRREQREGRADSFQRLFDDTILRRPPDVVDGASERGGLLCGPFGIPLAAKGATKFTSLIKGAIQHRFDPPEWRNVRRPPRLRRCSFATRLQAYGPR